MKKLIIFLVYFLPYLIFSQTISDSAVNYWDFNSNAIDRISGIEGISHNSVMIIDRNGLPNGAYEFNGTSSYISTNQEGILGREAVSVSVWFKTENSENLGCLISWGSNSTGAQFHLSVENCVIFSRTGQSALNGGLSQICDNMWHNIIFTKPEEGKVSDIKIYLNGEEQTLSIEKNPDAILDFGNNYSINIGRDQRTGDYFAGAIDEITIYNKVLSEEEILLINTESDVSEINCSNIHCDGDNVAIGTSDSKGYKLAIAGKTITEEVKVARVENWPDFVFKNDYERRTLEELEEHISENGHLPEIPSEVEVTENGINLGEMNAKLLQKIEELTLYMIDMNKQMKSQNERVEQLETQNAELKNKIQLLEN